MHLLAALLEQPEALLTRAVAIFGVDIKELHSRIATSALDARMGVQRVRCRVSPTFYVGMDFDT